MAPNNGVVSFRGLIVSFGELLIDFVSMFFGVLLAEALGLLKASKGPPANMAITITRLRGMAAFVKKLDNDEFELMLAWILEQDDISVKDVLFDQRVRSTLAFVTLCTNGEQEFIFCTNPSAVMMLKPDELDLDLIRSDGVRGSHDQTSPHTHQRSFSPSHDIEPSGLRNTKNHLLQVMTNYVDG